MKKKFLLSIALLFSLLFQKSFGQTFINGDFENNICTGCDYNIPDTAFNSRISNVFAFGKTFYGGKYVGEIDIQKAGCYCTPKSGNWCIGIASDFSLYTTSDAIAIELTSNLVPGNLYQLSFYVFGNTTFSSILTNVKIGESLTNSTFGVTIDTVAPVANTWKLVALNFIATQSSKYITVQNIPGTNSWNQLDMFTIGNITGINSMLANISTIQVFPNPTSGLVIIRTDNLSNFKSAKIRNVFGEVLFNTNSSIVDFSHLQTGLYYIEVFTDKGKYVTRILRETYP